jgi:hypothetical protein
MKNNLKYPTPIIFIMKDTKIISKLPNLSLWKIMQTKPKFAIKLHTPNTNWRLPSVLTLMKSARKKVIFGNSQNKLSFDLVDSNSYCQ